MKIIAGLGNPGREYEGTRHNLGFRVADGLVERWGWSYDGSDFESVFGAGEFSGERCVVLKPLTYVNLSGRAVSAALKYFDCPLDNLLVICDDLNLPLGKLRLRRKGGSGGHKGLQSIIETLGSEEFHRLRIGIGDDVGDDAREFVLSPFTEEEEEIIVESVRRACDAVEAWLTRGIDYAMNIFNA